LCVVVVVGVYLVVRTPFFLPFLLCSAIFLLQSGPTAVVSDDAVAGHAPTGPLLLCQTVTHAHARRPFKASVITGFDSISRKITCGLWIVTYRLALQSSVDYDVNKEAGGVTSGQITGRTVRSHVGPSRDSPSQHHLPSLGPLYLHPHT